MRMHRWWRLALAAVVMLGCSAPAAADVTAFLGVAGAPSSRVARGLAVSGGLLIVAFEFEYSDAIEDTAEGTPRLRTGMFNGIVQTPWAVSGVQLYATAGGGLYNQELGATSTTNFGLNIGGGVKINLIGPLRMRVDYRIFRLGGSPMAADQVQRVYVGANLRF